jgi:hypothetical protein
MAKTYISPSNTYSFEYPDDWKVEREYGAVVLFKKGGLFKKNSSNILRLTPLLSEKIISAETYASIINFRKREHPDLEAIDKSDKYIMNFHILKFRQEIIQMIGEKNIRLTQDCWELYINDRIFSCSFTYAQGEEDNPKAKEEKDEAEKILYSIKLL